MAVAISRTADPAGAGSGTTITYSGQAIGVAEDSRIVVVCVGTELNSGTPSSATLNYGTGALAMTAGTLASFGAMGARIFWLPAPTGTTADIAVTFGASQGSTTHHLCVYRVVGADNESEGAATSTDMDSTAPLTTGSITIKASGGFIAVAAGATAAGKTWANATEDLDESGGTFEFTTATRVTALSATAVTCTGGTNGEDGALAWLILRPGVIAGAGSYALTGTAATLTKGHPIVAGVGSYSLTGTAAVLTKGHPLAAGAGSYALAGAAATLKQGRVAAAAAGSYALTGTAATLRRGGVLAAGIGSYALAGATAGLLHQWRAVAGAGAFAFTGSTATLRRNLPISVTAGSYALTGADATLTIASSGTLLSAASGAYLLTGAAASTIHTWRLPLAAGSYLLTGASATLQIQIGTVWNAADKSANIALGRTGAWSSASNANWKSARATSAKSTGKWYIEIIGGYLANNGHIVGFANSTASLGNFLGSDGNSFGYQSEGSVWGLAGNWQGSGFIGEIIKLAIDLDAKLVWGRTDAAPNWNNSALANPATGVGGKSYTTTGALFPACSLYGDLALLHNNAAILNPGSSTFAGAVPSGFTAWDTNVPTSIGISGTRPTTWDSANKNAAIVLSGNNLVATQSGGSNDWRGVRSTTSYDSGLHYFEATITATSVGGWEIGLQDGDEVFSGSTGPGSSWRSIAFRNNTNDIYFMNLSNIGTVVWSGGEAGQVIGVAADMSRGLVWAKNITTGSDWNADANADPVLGKRGSYIGSIKPMYIAWGGNRALGVDDVVTLNAGATPFSGTLPTGYSAWDDTSSGNLHMRGFMVNLNRMMNT